VFDDSYEKYIVNVDKYFINIDDRFLSWQAICNSIDEERDLSVSHLFAF